MNKINDYYHDMVTDMKKFIFSVLLILLAYSLIEISCFCGLILLKKFRGIEYRSILTTSLSQGDQQTLQSLITGKTTYLLYSPILGWTIKPNGFWQDLYRANSKGIRGTKEYQFFPPKSIIRIATFGDSFTHGEEVKNEFTWQEQMIRLNPHLEVINFGVGGYGLDQAFLRYSNEGKLYHPHIVLMGFMQDNINRLVNVYRPFYAPGIPLTKPRFILQDNSLVLLPNPLADLNNCKDLLRNPKPLLSQFGENDFHFSVRAKDNFFDFSPSVRIIKLIYHILYKGYLMYIDRTIYKNGCFNKKGEAFIICQKVFDKFYDQVKRNNSLPIIVLFPDRTDIKRYRLKKTRVYEPLINYFVLQGYRYIDLLDAFEKYGQSLPLKDLFVQDHYSTVGNSIVAHFLLDYLTENKLIELPVIQHSISTNQREQIKKP